MESKIKKLRIFAEEIRVETLKEIGNVGFGHIGGAMSIVETIAVLYGEAMKYDPKNPNWEDRDRLVLSKGHAGPTLYATLALKGFFPMEMLKELNQGGGHLPSHCDRTKTPGIDMTTGSLGQGISAAIGMALGNRMNGKDSYVYLVIGDGECNEGQIWEGAMAAPQFKLDKLICFVDWNKMQLDGYTKDIIDLGDIGQKFEDFGWYKQEIDGHNLTAICEAIENAKKNTGKPSVIILDTIKGNGCNFAVNNIDNHHMRFKPEQMVGALEVAEAQLEKARAGQIDN